MCKKLLNHETEVDSQIAKDDGQESPAYVVLGLRTLDEVSKAKHEQEADVKALFVEVKHLLLRLDDERIHDFHVQVQAVGKPNDPQQLCH